jgi:sialate O-acetylesterase
MKKALLFLFIILLISCSKNESKLILPTIISDNMVLQQKSDAKLWGWSSPGKKVVAEASWGTTVKTKTGKDGKWMLSLKTPEFGGPFSINFKSGNQTIEIKNVMVGEVWLCSGQSNMEMPLKGWPPKDMIDNYKEEISKANYPKIRMFTVQRAISPTPIEDCSGNWKLCTPDSVGDFSATAYFFGAKLYNELNVPIGLIHSSWGGTPAESWTEIQHLKTVSGYESIEQELSKGTEEYKAIQNKISKLKTIPISELPGDNPFENLDLNDNNYLSENLDVNNWDEMQIPGFWEKSVLPNFDGIVWIRAEFEIPKNIYPEGFELYLGPVDDMDATYINGVKIGSNEVAGVWAKERRYTIPTTILKEEKNVVLVKITDTGGGGGIHGPKGPAIYKGNKKIVDLSGKWKYKPVAVFMDNNICVFDAKTGYKDLPKLKYGMNSKSPTLLYNAMIAPIIPYSIKGAIWYQGESNVGRGEQYKTLFPTMIKCWRDNWNLGDFPFYYVQIAPYNYGQDDATALLREAQLETLSQNNVGMAVTMDIGNPKNIHPGNKKDVGNRLALWALAKNYGKEEIVCSGPIFKEATFTDLNVDISFDYAESGLKLSTSETFFEIAGEDKVFYPADVEIDKNKLHVSSTKVSSPKYVRYAWGDDVEPNLFNLEGLPASPFRVNK